MEPLTPYTGKIAWNGRLYGTIVVPTPRGISGDTVEKLLLLRRSACYILPTLPDLRWCGDNSSQFYNIISRRHSWFSSRTRDPLESLESTTVNLLLYAQSEPMSIDSSTTLAELLHNSLTPRASTTFAILCLAVHRRPQLRHPNVSSDLSTLVTAAVATNDCNHLACWPVAIASTLSITSISSSKNYSKLKHFFL